MSLHSIRILMTSKLIHSNFTSNSRFRHPAIYSMSTLAFLIDISNLTCPRLRVLMTCPCLSLQPEIKQFSPSAFQRNSLLGLFQFTNVTLSSSQQLCTWYCFCPELPLPHITSSFCHYFELSSPQRYYLCCSISKVYLPVIFCEYSIHSINNHVHPWVLSVTPHPTNPWIS